MDARKNDKLLWLVFYISLHLLSTTEICRMPARQMMHCRDDWLRQMSLWI